MKKENIESKEVEIKNEVENILRQSEELKDNGAHGIFIHKNDFIKAAFYQEKIMFLLHSLLYQYCRLLCL